MAVVEAAEEVVAVVEARQAFGFTAFFVCSDSHAECCDGVDLQCSFLKAAGCYGLPPCLGSRSERVMFTLYLFEFLQPFPSWPAVAQQQPDVFADIGCGSYQGSFHRCSQTGIILQEVSA